jgi:hypothetical protein
MQALDAYFESGGAEGGAPTTGGGRTAARTRAAANDDIPELVTPLSAFRSERAKPILDISVHFKSESP